VVRGAAIIDTQSNSPMMKAISIKRTVSAQANDDADIRDIMLMRTCSAGIYM
jgi:hypothetical protein